MIEVGRLIEGVRERVGEVSLGDSFEGRSTLFSQPRIAGGSHAVREIRLSLPLIGSCCQPRLLNARLRPGSHLTTRNFERF
jgi:hypothetical protein